MVKVLTRKEILKSKEGQADEALRLIYRWLKNEDMDFDEFKDLIHVITEEYYDDGYSAGIDEYYD